MNKISALIVTYNEEKTIERCLSSISGVVDEIIIIHDGKCSDGTLRIAQKYTNRIYEQNIHKGMGEAWYMFGISKCRYEWILRIDSDEYLSENLKFEFRKLLSNSHVDGYSFNWPMWDGSKYISRVAYRKLFIFRRSKLGFLDKYHYPLRIMGKVHNSNLIVEHKPTYNNYARGFFEIKQKKIAQLQAMDHLVPIKDRQYINLSYKDLVREQNIKNAFYKFPILTFIASYIISSSRIISEPWLILDKGFWSVIFFVSRYSFEVAKSVKQLLKQKNDKTKRIL